MRGPARARRKRGHRARGSAAAQQHDGSEIEERKCLWSVHTRLGSRRVEQQASTASAASFEPKRPAPCAASEREQEQAEQSEKHVVFACARAVPVINRSFEGLLRKTKSKRKKGLQACTTVHTH